MTGKDFQALAPLKSYADSGLPPAPEKIYVDKRTGRPYGEVPEDDIVKNVADMYSVATVMRRSESDIYPTLQSLKTQIDDNEPARNLRTSIFESVSGWFQMTDLESKAGLMAKKHAETGDDRYKLEGTSLLEKAAKLREEFPSVPRHSKLDTFIMDTVNGMASVYNMTPKVVAGGMVGGMAGFVAGIPAGMELPAMYKGIQIGAAYGGSQGMFDLETGSAYLEMINYEDPGTGQKIDPKIAWEVAQVYGLAATGLEGIKVATVLDSFKVLKASKIGSRLYNFALQAGKNYTTGGVTEGTQSLTQSLAMEIAKKLTAQKYGVEFSPANTKDILSQAAESTRAGANAEVAMGAISAGVGAMNTSAIRMIQDRSKVEAEIADKVNKEIDDRIDRENIKLASAATTVAVQDTDSPLPTRVAEITDEERAKAHNTVGIRGIEVSDRDIENLILNEESEDEILNALADKATQPENSEVAGDFFSEVHAILPLEQAEYVESLYTARAEALGIGVAEYLEERGVSLQQGVSEEGNKAQIDFRSEGEAIITAFQGADISSIVHETGHLFRQDIRGNDATVLNEWVGAKLGEVWTQHQEEMFARGFERYLAEGKAPTKELTGVFQKLSRWLLEIYGAIKNSDIDVNLTPEVRAVFDRLFQDRQTAEKLSTDPIAHERQVLNQAAQKTTEAKTKQEVKEMSEVELLKQQVKVLTKQARDAMAVADKAGYDKKVAEMKALFQRKVERGKLKARHKAVQKKIIKKLKRWQPKKKSGIKKSKVSPEVQERLTSLLELMKGIKSMKQAHEEYLRRRVAEGFQEVDSIEMHLLHNLSFVDHSSVDALETLYKDLTTSLIDPGKAESFFGRVMAWKANMKPRVLEDILGEGNVLPEALGKYTAKEIFESAGRKERIERGLKNLTIGHDFLFGIRGMLEMIAQNAPGGPRESTLVKEFEVYDAEEQRRTEVREDNDKFLSDYGEVFGVRGKSNQIRAIWKDAVANIDYAGMKWSKNELRYSWLVLKDPTLTKRLSNQGYTSGELSEVGALLSDKDKAVALKMSVYFNNDSRFEKMSDVFRSIFGNDLERLKQYVPVTAQEPLAAEHEAYSLLGMEKNAPQFTEDFRLRATAETTGRIKERVKSDKVKMDVKQDLFAVAHAYAEETAHFRNMAILVRKMNAMFGDTDIRNAIVSQYGPKVYDSLMKNIEAVALNGMDTRESIKAVDNIRTAFVLSKIAMSVPTFIKQHISGFNYADLMPVSEFVKGQIKFFEHPVRNYKEIAALDFVKNRGHIIDRDFVDMMRSPERRSYLKDPSFLNAITWLLRTGDRNGIVAGWAYREWLMTPEGGGLTKEQANRQLGYESIQTQQSGANSELSNYQRGGTAAKFTTMWSTGPIQAVRREAEAVRARVKGRTTSSKMLKTLFIYHILVPQLYALVSNTIKTTGGGEWDWWDHGAAAVLGPVGTSFTVGRQLQSMFSYMLGGKYRNGMGPFQSITRDISRVGRKIKDGKFDELTVDDWAKMIEGTMILGGAGAPVVRTERMAQGAADMISGDVRKGAVHLMGQSIPKKRRRSKKKYRY